MPVSRVRGRLISRQVARPQGAPAPRGTWVAVRAAIVSLSTHLGLVGTCSVKVSSVLMKTATRSSVIEQARENLEAAKPRAGWRVCSITNGKPLRQPLESKHLQPRIQNYLTSGQFKKLALSRLLTCLRIKSVRQSDCPRSDVQITYIREPRTAQSLPGNPKGETRQISSYQADTLILKPLMRSGRRP